MRSRWPLVLLVLSLAGPMLCMGSPSLAAGVDIAWDSCRGEPGATSLKQFACNVEAGGEFLWISFESAVSAASMGRIEVAIDFQTRNGSQLPVWWDFEGFAGCRHDQLFVDSAPPFETPTCARMFTSTDPPHFVVDRIDYQLPTPDAGRLVVAANVTGPLVANQRYLGCRLFLTHARTAACSGCDVPVSVTVTAVRIGGIVLSNPITQNFVHWQQQQPTATRTSTWAALKGLFR
jgi:hypothetical protein